MSWELDVWGQLRRATEASRAELMATEEARRAIILSLISQVAQTYFELRALDRELENHSPECGNTKRNTSYCELQV